MTRLDQVNHLDQPASSSSNSNSMSTTALASTTTSTSVAAELYFLVAKLLAAGPLAHLAQDVRRDLERAQILPPRTDWLGQAHPQTFQEFESQYADVNDEHLLSVCEAILRTKTPTEPKRSLLDCNLFRKRYPKICNNVLQRVIARQTGVRRGCFLPATVYGSLQLQRRTLGHLNSTYCVLFDRTGRFIVTGADDLLVKIWSAIDGRLIVTLRGAAAEITDMTVDIDNRLLAAGSLDRLVRVWDLQTAAPVAVLQGHSGMITSVHFCPAKNENLSYLVSTSTDGSVAFWTYNTSQCGKRSFISKPIQYVERMRPGACQMICCAWSPGGLFLASGSADHHVRVYMMQESGPKRILEVAAHCEAVDSLQWAHSGLRFVSGSKDGSAILWQLHSTQWRHSKLNMSETLPGQVTNMDDSKKTKVTMVAWDCTDSYVITAVNDYTLKVWCSLTGKLIRILRGHCDEVYVLEAHPNHPSVLLSAGHDGNIFIWDILKGITLTSFANHIDGQGNGAVYDAKWSPDGSKIAATDSHGHLLMLGLGKGHHLLTTLPTELFFHTDYRPLVRDVQGAVCDEQTGVPPHLMPPPFLVDVEGAPHPPPLQKLVPGRENATLDQLVPDTGEANIALQDGDVPRSHIDYMIEALALRHIVNGLNGEDEEIFEVGFGPGRIRTEGVRNSAGEWQRGNPLSRSRRPLVDNLSFAESNSKRLYVEEMTQYEMEWYKREMRRRPTMISTTGWNAESGPPKKSPRKPRQRKPKTEDNQRAETMSIESSETESTEKASDSDSEVSLSMPSYDDSSSSSSDYSDWVADLPGVPLQPPKRSKRKPAPKPKYRNRNAVKKNPVASTSSAAPETTSDVPMASTSSGPSVIPDIPEPYRPSEWLCAVQPRKAPYHPQMGDECMYFKQGHERYLDAVTDKSIYKVSVRDKPWERTKLKDCESVKVVGIKYVLRPPRLVCLKLMLDNGSHFTVRYHDMPDVLDFLVLRQAFEQANNRGWSPADRFRCMIDDSWWLGTIVEDNGRNMSDPGSQFLSLKVRWDNGEFEQMSPWDLEQIDDSRLPQEVGGNVSVLPIELETLLYRPRPEEWLGGERREACELIARGIDQVMGLAIAEPFLAPVDLNIYPTYAYVVEYPIDLSTVKARFENHFYRRVTSAQFDVRYLATNAEKFNRPGSPIIKQARIITDLCLQIISNPFTIDVPAAYRSLVDSYQSSDSDATYSKQRNYKTTSRTRGRNWLARCRTVLNGIYAASDSQPFREPVSMDQLPEYSQVVARPMDLSTVRQRLDSGIYHDPSQFAADMKLIFANSKLYNTNKRSRIYSMTLRLESLFESLFAPLARNAKNLRRRNVNGAGSSYSDNSDREKFNGFHNGHNNSSSDSDNDDDDNTRRNGYMNGGLRLNGNRLDSSDSDVPLSRASKTYKGKGKGKGVGKKSSAVDSEPKQTRSTRRAVVNGNQDEDDEDEEEHNSHSSSEEETADSQSSSDDDNQVDSEDSYKPTKDRTSAHTSSRSSNSKKRKRKQNSERPPAKRRRRSKKRKRGKQKSNRRSSAEKSETSSDSEQLSVVSEGSGKRRYESDHSFQVKPETQSESDDDDDDDNAPLGSMRSQDSQGNEDDNSALSRLRSRRLQPNSDESQGAGPSGVRVRRTVRDTARQPQYNEDSEEDSIATISKRLRAHQRSGPPLSITIRRLSRGMVSTANNNNNNAHPVAGPSHRDQGSGDSSPDDNEPLSVSSRGRVRRLTPKARGLLRD